MGVTVAPQFRRKGIGLELVHVRLDWISQPDSHAYYFTNARNIASVAMHEGTVRITVDLVWPDRKERR